MNAFSFWALERPHPQKVSSPGHMTAGKKHTPKMPCMCLKELLLNQKIIENTCTVGRPFIQVCH